MGLYVDPSWVMCKDAFLEMVWLLTDEFSPSEVAKLVPPLELVLVCWGHLEVEDFNLSLW